MVSPTRNGLGLGAEIVDMLEEKLRAAGKETARLLVAEKNIPAMKTYRKCGYAFVGKCSMYDDEYIACEKKI